LINIIIFAPADDLAHTSPRGFTFADQVFSEAGYHDSVSKSQRGAAKLQRTLGYLLRRYPGRLQVHWVNPWSPQGLLFAIRQRQRKFPAVILQRGNQRLVLTGADIDHLDDHIAQLLSQPVEP
jgi:hypothetical protein